MDIKKTKGTPILSAEDKGCLVFVANLLLKLYEAFIFQQLWNWFVVRAFRLDPIGYPTMLGITLIVVLFRTSDDSSIDLKVQKLELSVRACVPEEKQEALETAVKEAREGLWSKLKMFALAELISDTVILILGAFISGLQ
jgi:hypothetical protein